MDEKTFSKKLRKGLLEQGLPSVNLQNITSEPACPDLNILDAESGIEGFFELKVLRDGQVEFRPGQVLWLSSREKAGGISGVITLFPGASGVGKILCLRGREASSLEKARGSSLESLREAPRPPGEGFLYLIPSPGPGWGFPGLGEALRAFLRSHPNSPALRLPLGQGNTHPGL